MEDRCEKFFINSKIFKQQDIQKLKKFLFKNQDYKFKDNEKVKLYSAIEVFLLKQCYYSYVKNNPQFKDLVFSLIEDALAMPFNIFTSPQKGKMLKWYELLQKEETFQNTQKDLQQEFELSSNEF